MPPRPKRPVKPTSTTTSRVVPIAIAAVAILVAGWAIYVANTPNVHILTPNILHNQTCHESVSSCDPIPFCTRLLIPDFITKAEALSLRTLADSAMSYGGGAGGPTIFDLVSGALSRGDQFINIYKTAPEGVFNRSHIQLYVELTNRVRETLASRLGVVSDIGLSSPSFISRIRGNVKARTKHDEYWHEHVDKVQYGSFVYTALIYLSDYGTDFTGGEFAFIDSPESSKPGVASKPDHVHEPHVGQLLIFTSGHENVHAVRRVASGVRYAVTVAFTCEPSKKVPSYLNSHLKPYLQETTTMD